MTILNLAGPNEPARALLEAARDGIDPADIDTLIAKYTVPTVGQPDTRRWLLLVDLENWVDLWTGVDNGDPEIVGLWTVDEITTQIVASLFLLTTGQQPCRCRRPGGLNAPRPVDTVDQLHTEQACPAKEAA